MKLILKGILTRSFSDYLKLNSLSLYQAVLKNCTFTILALYNSRSITSSINGGVRCKSKQPWQPSLALNVLATERRKIRLRSARTTLLKMSERFSVKRHARNEPGSGAGKQHLTQSIQSTCTKSKSIHLPAGKSAVSAKRGWYALHKPRLLVAGASKWWRK